LPSLESRVVGPMPFVAAFCRKAGLPHLFDRLLGEDPRCRVPFGTRLLALLLHILSGRPPLYKVATFFEDTDTGLLLGEGIPHDALHDDSLGRLLDRIHAYGPARFFQTVALHCTAGFQIAIDRLHWDSTSISLTGNHYDVADDDALQITHGYSKDHRPDLRQFLYSLLVNREGIPIWAAVKNGNASDKTLNHEVIEEISKVLRQEELKQITYVADSACVTRKNLKKFRAQSLKFLSRVPDTFAEVRRLKERAWESGQWKPLGRLSSKKDAAVYRAVEWIGTIDEVAYRFLVVHSDHLDRRKEQALLRRLASERADLEQHAQELARETYSCQSDATAARERFLREHPTRYRLEAKVICEEVEAKRGRGRPRKDEERPQKVRYRVQVEVGDLDEEAVQRERERESTFVLITNVGEEELDSRELLVEYKEQSRVEVRFKFLKDPLFVDAFYLHKASRVEALAYVLLIALLVYSLIEREARATLEKEGRMIELIGKRKSSRPTGVSLLEMLVGLSVRRTGYGQRQLVSPAHMIRRAQVVLAAVGLDLRAYQQAPT